MLWLASTFLLVAWWHEYNTWISVNRILTYKLRSCNIHARANYVSSSVSRKKNCHYSLILTLVSVIPSLSFSFILAVFISWSKHVASFRLNAVPLEFVRITNPVAKFQLLKCNFNSYYNLLVIRKEEWSSHELKLQYMSPWKL